MCVLLINKVKISALTFFKIKKTTFIRVKNVIGHMLKLDAEGNIIADCGNSKKQHLQ